MAAALLALVLLSAQQPVDRPPTADNSLLVEEAYNQEAGVVQHASVFARAWTGGTWAYTFVQEWPGAWSRRQQISYAVTGLNAGAGIGLGDLGLGWRYQWLDTPRVAMAPRVSVALPTGDARRFRGAGAAALEVALPVSVSTSHVTWHTNVAAVTSLERGRPGGHGLRLAQGLVFRPWARVNPLIEIVHTSVGGDRVTSVSPGVRWLHTIGAMQIVPAVATPIDLTPGERPAWHVIGYLSLEHPFGGRR